MTEWLSSMGPAVGNHLWQSTAVAGVVWLATFLLRRNQARVRYGLWLAASVKFLIPLSLLVGLGSLLPKPQHVVVAMPVSYAMDTVAQPFTEMEMVPVVADSTHTAMMPRHEWGTRHLIPLTLGTIWFCGVMVVLTIWGVRWRQVAKTLRQAELVEDGREWEIIRRLHKAMGARRQIPLLKSQKMMEPGMFGIFRPVLIWPERLSERLDDEHIEAILAHELRHAQRRDNLTAVIHMVVEAAFWFYPLVWWMERRMVEERERACDEAVVEMGSRPGIYAESLLKACRFCVESPLVCVSGITGADLSKRVLSIMTLRLERLSMGKKVTLALFGLTVIAVPILLGQATAAQRVMLAAANAAPIPFRTAMHAMIAEEQTPSTALIAEVQADRQVPMGTAVAQPGDEQLGPEFEVASIRPTSKGNDGGMGVGLTPSGRVTIMRETVTGLIVFAYLPNIGSGLVQGGPKWADSEEFDINAKVEDAEVATWGKLSDKQRQDCIRPMVRTLLAERFHLKMHTETQVKPVFALVQAKGGAKLKEVTPPPPNLDPQALEDWRKSAHQTALPGAFMMAGDTWTGNAIQIGVLMNEIAANANVDRLVVDETGLKGFYSFTFKESREKDAPILLDQIEDQLGLKLESRKLPVKTYVIESVDQPSVDGAEVSALQAAPNPSQVVLQSHPTAASLPAFEVATIKPFNPNAGGQPVGFYSYPGGRVHFGVADVKMLLHFAFNMQSYQISGGPDWTETDRYDIEAVPPDSSPSRASKLSPFSIAPTGEQRQMIQSLLRDRFALQYHMETREGEVYLLTRGSGKLQFQEPKDKDMDWRGAVVDKGGIYDGEAHGENISMAALAGVLSQDLHMTVIDQTGLAGNFDFHLTPDDPQNTDLEAAVFDSMHRLGLNLKKGRGPVETLVIDHIERPSEN